MYSTHLYFVLARFSILRASKAQTETTISRGPRPQLPKLHTLLFVPLFT